jgi:hypothetical protein
VPRQDEILHAGLAGSRVRRLASGPANFVSIFQARSITSRLEEMIPTYLGVSGPAVTKVIEKSEDLTHRYRSFRR